MSELDEVSRAQHAAELGFAESAISATYEAKLIEPKDPEQVPELVVDLGTDEEKRPRTMRLSFIPTGDAVEHTKLLQMYVPLPYSAPADSLATVRQAIAIINEALAVGRFGMHDDGTLYFRYVLAAPKYDMIDDDMLTELVTFVEFHQENFGDYLEGVCEGEVSVAVLPQVIREAG